MEIADERRREVVARAKSSEACLRGFPENRVRRDEFVDPAQELSGFPAILAGIVW